MRNPAVLAKTITTLDLISNGRAVLGIGAGWDVDEHAAYNVAFPTGGERWERLEEAIQLCRAMFSSEQADYAGSHYSVAGAWNVPQPVQAKVPILIGGSGPKRTLPLVAKYADACNFFGEQHEVLQAIANLRTECERIGRDYNEITKTSAVFPPPDIDELNRQVEDHLEAGIEAIILVGHECPQEATIEAWGELLRTRFG
jgi:alkanesulfonate monooxygenase SsuD/methylene tetrahydromethanopterin reductase-like flavin-dependent oxidoreductase (luciferase family)